MPAVNHPRPSAGRPPMSGDDTAKVTPARLRRDAYLYLSASPPSTRCSTTPSRPGGNTT
jgi:hypothetical protein